MIKKILFFRPTLGDGGADRVTLTLLQHLDRTRFAPSLALVRREGVLVDDVPVDVSMIDLGVRRLALAIPELARTIDREQPDIVACTSSAANVVCIAAHRLANSRARLVISERSSLIRRERSSLRSVIELRLKKLTYPRADAVMAVSDGVGDELVSRLGLPRDRVQVVYNPVVGDDLEPRAREQVDHPWFAAGAPPVALAVGRLVEVKDYPTMLAAIAKVPNARLVVLGNGPLHGDLEARVRALGLAARVAFLGFDKNPYRYMRRACVLMQSSRAEGLPSTLIQSMACGTPVVATDCAHGPREVVRDGVDGYLVRVGDVDALAARAGELLRNDALRVRMSAEGVASSRRFDLRSSMARYQTALEGRA